MTLIKDLPLVDKPREKFKRYGINYLSNEDLIAIILRTGTKSVSVKDLAINITKNINLNNINYNKLKNINGIGEVKAITLLCAIELGKRVNNIVNEEIIAFNNSSIIYNYFKKEFSMLNKEMLLAVFLDNKSKLINYKNIFIGTANQSITHPREIFKEAIDNNSLKIVLLHNHPSGDINPSLSDKIFTKRIYETGKIIGIPLVDHIIVGKNNYYSFYDNGDLNEKNNN